MSDNTNNTAEKRTLTENIFGAEENSAASIGKEHLGKYSNLAVKMFHTGVLSPKEMLYPAFGQFAAKLVKGLSAYRTLYFVNVLKIDMAYVTVILTLISIYDILN
ncbi:MAG: hypothetical protein IJM02_06570, partial [Clostridia bacterium]|nr:hypothetical protein [Clostridia bacterium]